LSTKCQPDKKGSAAIPLKDETKKQVISGLTLKPPVDSIICGP
jgi:hypothetical protein